MIQLDFKMPMKMQFKSSLNDHILAVYAYHNKQSPKEDRGSMSMHCLQNFMYIFSLTEKNKQQTVELTSGGSGRRPSDAGGGGRGMSV